MFLGADIATPTWSAGAGPSRSSRNTLPYRLVAVRRRSCGPLLVVAPHL